MQKSSFTKINPRENVSAYSMAPASTSFLRHLKLVSAIFIKFLFFQQMIAFQSIWKCFLFHLKSSFRSRDVQFFVFFPLLSTLSRLKRTNGSGIIYDVMNWRS